MPPLIKPEKLPEWESKQVGITLIREDGSSYREWRNCIVLDDLVALSPVRDSSIIVQGILYGKPDEECWSITLIVPGFRIARVVDFEDAVKVAEVLWRNVKVREAIRDIDVRKLVTKLPEWVKPWVCQCNIENKFVDPASFKSKSLLNAYTQAE